MANPRGRPRTKRKYTKHVKTEVVEVKPEVSITDPVDISKEFKAEEPKVAVEEKPKKQHEMFHNLLEGQLDFETVEMRKKQAEKDSAEREQEKLAKENKGKPFLECPFCQNIQYESYSKDPSSAWCTRCGRAFQLAWKR